MSVPGIPRAPHPAPATPLSGEPQLSSDVQRHHQFSNFNPTPHFCFPSTLGHIFSDFRDTSSIPAGQFPFNFLSTSSFFFSLSTTSDIPSCFPCHLVNPNDCALVSRIWSHMSLKPPSLRLLSLFHLMDKWEVSQIWPCYSFNMKCPSGLLGSRPDCQLISFQETTRPESSDELID